jgi:hypothetical protein
MVIRHRQVPKMRDGFLQNALRTLGLPLKKRENIL